MAHFDLYGLGNALVDTEYHISDELLAKLGVEKGMMTLIDDAQLTVLEEQLRSRGELKKASVRWIGCQLAHRGRKLRIQGVLQLQSSG